MRPRVALVGISDPVQQLYAIICSSSAILLTLSGVLPCNAKEKPHVTSEQVTRLFKNSKNSRQKQIQVNAALPGLAIAVVFQDRAVTRKGLVRNASAKVLWMRTLVSIASLSKPIGSTVVASWSRRKNHLGLKTGRPRSQHLRDLIRGSRAKLHPRHVRASQRLTEHAGDLLEDLGFTRAEICIAALSHTGSSFSFPLCVTRILA